MKGHSLPRWRYQRQTKHTLSTFKISRTARLVFQAHLSQSILEWRRFISFSFFFLLFKRLFFSQTVLFYFIFSYRAWLIMFLLSLVYYLKKFIRLVWLFFLSNLTLCTKKSAPTYLTFLCSKSNIFENETQKSILTME